MTEKEKSKGKIIKVRVQMTCQIKDRSRYIELYLEGKLSQKEKEHFEEHIFECDLCFQELLFQQETAKVFKAEGQRLLMPEVKHESIKEKVVQALQNLVPSFGDIRWKHVFAYVSVVTLILLGSYFIFEPFGSDTLNVNFDNQVPYKFNNLHLRGNSGQSQIDPMLDIFIKNFQSAIGDYNIFEYKSAVKTFEQLEPLAEKMLQEPDAKKRLAWVRDFYFYKGLSHLAIAGKKNSSREVKKDQSGLAIENIQRAIEISKEFALNKTDRESYFLMMAFLIKGDRERAQEVFAEIPAKSPFHFKAKKLLSR